MVARHITFKFRRGNTTTTSASASTFYGGVDSTGNSGYWDGDIGELMFWTRPLSVGEITAVENYLTTKWNV